MTGSDWFKASSILWLVTCAGLAAAQSTDLEPGVQTSPTPSSSNAPAPITPLAPAPNPQPSSAPQGAKSAAKSAPAPAARSAAASGASPGGAPTAATKAPASGKGQDRIELDTTQISGNRELPKVMYVVPWRKADIGEFAGRPPNSLLDEALTPVDRDVFRRQNRYYSALEAGSAASKSQPGAAGGETAAPEAKDEK